MTHIIQSSSEGGTCSPPAPPHRLQNSKWALGGPKMADMVWKVVYSYFFGRSKQLSLDKFFDPRTLSMRKGCDGGEKKTESLSDNFLFSKHPQFQLLLKYWGHFKNLYSDTTNSVGVDGKNSPLTPQIVVSTPFIIILYY